MPKKSTSRRYTYPRVLSYGVGAEFHASEKNAIWERDKGLCVYCGGPGQEIDHVIPYSKGGPTIRANGVLSCTSCNRDKRANLRLEQLTRAFYYLLSVGENLAWVDEFWGIVFEMRDNSH